MNSFFGLSFLFWRIWFNSARRISMTCLWSKFLVLMWRMLFIKTSVLQLVPSHLVTHSYDARSSLLFGLCQSWHFGSHWRLLSPFSISSVRLMLILWIVLILKPIEMLPSEVFSEIFLTMSHFVMTRSFSTLKVTHIYLRWVTFFFTSVLPTHLTHIYSSDESDRLHVPFLIFWLIEINKFKLSFKSFLFYFLPKTEYKYSWQFVTEGIPYHRRYWRSELCLQSISCQMDFSKGEGRRFLMISFHKNESSESSDLF